MHIGSWFHFHNFSGVFFNVCCLQSKLKSQKNKFCNTPCHWDCWLSSWRPVTQSAAPTVMWTASPRPSPRRPLCRRTAARSRRCATCPPRPLRARTSKRFSSWTRAAMPRRWATGRTCARTSYLIGFSESTVSFYLLIIDCLLAVFALFCIGFSFFKRLKWCEPMLLP